MNGDSNDFLGDNLTGEEPATKTAASKAQKVSKGEKKVRIMLEDNDQIPPGGQFIQANGRSFLLQPGVEMDVPLCVLDILDHAVMSVPVVDGMNSVVGYRDRLRFPYRVLTANRSSD